MSEYDLSRDFTPEMQSPRYGRISALDDLVHRADPAELLLEVDRLCERRDWAGLVTLRDRCEAAVELGKQLWPVAQFAEYRLALEGPGRYAASVCRTGAGRFTLGPLTEVASSRHHWDELADHLTTPWIAATVAQERVLRGEDLRGDPRARPDEFGLPLVLQPWEPSYPLPVYRSHDLSEGGPPPADKPFQPAAAVPAVPARLPGLARALADIGMSWAEQSNGGCRVAVVAGDAETAAVTLLGDSARLAATELDDALARLAWTAASGGAFGRRAGMAAGRSAAWWVAHTATGLPFPAHPDALGDALLPLRWYVLEGGRGQVGWNLRLAVDDPESGWAAAIDAWDRRLDDDQLL
ncbi:MAG: DUF6183 family protein [Actinomycetota bacterium]|nr:DUF6183 family protein [Actinomycetota bacterium]